MLLRFFNWLFRPEKLVLIHDNGLRPSAEIAIHKAIFLENRWVVYPYKHQPDRILILEDDGSVKGTAFKMTWEDV